MALRMSHAARQRAWLGGNVLCELRTHSDPVVKAVGTLVPYPCEINPPPAPFSPSTLLAGTPQPPVRPAKARTRDFVQYRLWFRTGEGIDPKRLGEAVRKISGAGLVSMTACGKRKKHRIFIAVERARGKALKAALRNFLPNVELVEYPSPFVKFRQYLRKGYRLEICHFYSKAPYWRAFTSSGDSLLRHEIEGFEPLEHGLGFHQLVIARAPQKWVSNVTSIQSSELRALELGHAGDWDFDGIRANKEILPNAPLYSIIFQSGVCVPPSEVREARDVVSQPHGNVFHGSKSLSVLDTRDYIAALGSPERIVAMLERNEVHAQGCLMNENEVGPLVPLPSAEEVDDGHLNLDTTLAPPVPPELQKGGTQVGWQPYTDKKLPVVIRDESRPMHVIIEGKTGAGKSETLLNIICGDLERHTISGGIVVDLGGVLCQQILKMLPKEWIDKTIYWNPVLPGHVFLFNPFACAGDISTLRENSVASIELLYKSSEWGSVIADHTRKYSHLLHAGEELCLGDASLIVSPSAAGERLRQEVLSHVEDEEILRYWEEGFSPKPGAMQKALLKVSPFLSQTAGRMFRQTENVIDFRKYIDEGYLILLDLPVGELIAATAADAIASFVLAQVNHAGMGRAQGAHTSPPSPWGEYIDESQRLAPRVLGEGVVHLRKGGICYVIVIQSRDLFSGKAQEAVRTIGSKIPLNLAPEDAAHYAREFAGVEAKQLTNKPVGTGWVFTGGCYVPIQALPPRKPGAGNYAQEVIEKSLGRYYITQEEFQERVRERRERLGLQAKRDRGYDEI